MNESFLKFMWINGEIMGVNRTIVCDLVFEYEHSLVCVKIEITGFVLIFRDMESLDSILF